MKEEEKTDRSLFCSECSGIQKGILNLEKRSETHEGDIKKMHSKADRILGGLVLNLIGMVGALILLVTKGG